MRTYGITLESITYPHQLYEFLGGACGGAIVEIMHWHRIARRGRWPQYARRPRYWIVTALMIAAGGIVTAAVSSPASSFMQLLLIGVAAPQLIESAAQSRVTKPSSHEVYLGAEKPGLLDFLGT